MQCQELQILGVSDFHKVKKQVNHKEKGLGSTSLMRACIARASTVDPLFHKEWATLYA
jgi:hypothetical protein